MSRRDAELLRKGSQGWPEDRFTLRPIVTRFAARDGPPDRRHDMRNYEFFVSRGCQVTTEGGCTFFLVDNLLWTIDKSIYHLDSRSQKELW